MSSSITRLAASALVSLAATQLSKAFALTKRRELKVARYPCSERWHLSAGDKRMITIGKRFAPLFALACATLTSVSFSTQGLAQTLGGCFLRQPGLCTVIGGSSGLCAVANGDPNKVGAGTCFVGGENTDCTCQAPKYTLLMSPFTPPVIPQGATATSTITVTPQSAPGLGWLGNVQLLVNPPCQSGCKLSPSVLNSTTQSQTPMTATLSITAPVNPNSSGGTITFSVTGQDSSLNSGPSNGTQTAQVTFAPPTKDGGGSAALLTFLSLMTLWIGLKSWHKRTKFRC
jgi:hypothetical protein